MSKFNYLIFLSIILLTLSCQSSDKASSPTVKTMFIELDKKNTGVTFKNQIDEDKDFHHLNWESVYNGAGVGTADFNNDGLMDLFFTGNQVKDALFINEGNKKFKDISDISGISSKDGWSSGVAIADINQDGFMDIYVSRMWHAKDGNSDDKRKNLLWINQGDLSFVEQAEKYGLADMGNGTQASFFDYDHDGDLDLYVLNAPSNNYAQKIEYINANKVPYVHSDKLFRNDQGKFVDVTKSAGVEDYGFGLGLVTVDMNQDGWTDIYVANDFEIADRMFINQKDGTFKDEVQRYLKHISFSSMGTDIADINNDDMADIAVLDMQSADHFRSKTNMPSMNAQKFWTNVSRGQHHQYMSNMLQLNQGDAFYSEIGQMAGLSSTDWSWSILMADFDQDEYKDIYITNGLNKDIRNNDFAEKLKKTKIKSDQELFEFSQQVPSQPIKNIMYQNQGDALHFSDQSSLWGANKNGFSYGAAYVDLDNDGDLDLVVNNNNDYASIYENTNNGNYLTIQIKNLGKDLYNAKAKIFYQGKTQSLESTPIRGFQSSVTPYLHFGLSAVDIVDSLYVTFPTGEMYKQSNINTNQTLVIDYQESTLISKKKNTEPTRTIFQDISKLSGIDLFHKENRYNDFVKESLLPHMQSRNNPYIAVADINKDKSTDFYIGASHGEAGTLFLANKKKYIKSSQTIFEKDKNHEDQGACFFDADQDGDLDLYVVSGGSEYPENDPIYQDRLYLNESGSFTQSNVLPQNHFNGSKVESADMNGDGMADLFVGGRSLPGKYPKADKSQLLINQHGTFVDKTIELAPGLREIGMVTDAKWIDINSDDLMDLIVVGEFMGVEVFENNGRQLIQKTSEYMPDHMNGWWYAVETVDLDGDGTMEILLGNIGLNNKYHPDPDHPLRIYGNDFDKNNTPDIVLSKVSDTYGEVPVRGRECSSNQMPFIKNQFKDYQSYAEADMLKIYGEKGLKEATKLYADNFKSGYLKKNNGKYQFISFPSLAQLSAVRDICTMDIDLDGDMDIILSGNMYDAEVETVRHDSSNGLVLENINGILTAIPFEKSNWYTPGNARQMALLNQGDEKFVLVTNNSFVTQLIKLNHEEN